MIIKFDHLSYSCGYEEEEKMISRFCDAGGGYTIQFKERVKNLPIKDEIMQNACDMHGMVMLQPADQTHFHTSVPIEITSYPKVSGYSAYNLGVGRIEFQTPNIKESAGFYQQLGFQKEDCNILSLTTLLDKNKVYIKLVESKVFYPCYLDVSGFSSIAWIVSKIEKYADMIKNRGIKVTNIEELVVNKRRLKICFAIGKQGELVELIGAD